MSLIDLRFAPGGGFRQTFLGIPRDAILRFLETNRRLEVQFVVEGPVDSPQFRLQEAMARRIAVAMAEKLGVPIRKIGEELIEFGTKGAEAVQKHGEALSGTLREILR
ncbi:MAG: hypothetical protein HY726_17475 [Candidatus Rokubacteria bacterium]|nr:hypothetical protein [Candidatus Rokubacteria bacterium]